MVTYGMVGAECTAIFEADFPQLYYRIRSLRDRMIGYFLRGTTYCYVTGAYRPSAAPDFIRVSFDREKAEEYEAFMRDFFARSRSAKCSTLPRPKFPVSIEIDFGGGACEAAEFHFETYGEDTVLGFCKRTAERAAYFYRHRFDRADQPAD